MRRNHARALEACQRELLRLNRAPRYCEVIRQAATAFLAWTDTKPLARVTRDDVRRYLALRREQGVAPSTQAGELTRLRAFFRALVVAGLVAEDPTGGLSVSTPRPRAQLLLGEEAVQALLAAALQVGPPPGERKRARALRDRACLELLYGLGVRSSEARAARVLDLNLLEGSLLVRRAKRGQPEVLPLPRASLPHLRRYLEEGRPLLAHAGRDKGHLLLSGHGLPYRHGSGINRLVNRVARKAGLTARPHAFRRGLATHLVRAGVSVTAVQRLLGHAKLSTTARYVEVDREDLRRAVAVLDRSG